MTEEQQKRLKAVHHVVHEYANFVSSAEIKRRTQEALYRELQNAWLPISKKIASAVR